MQSNIDPFPAVVLRLSGPEFREKKISLVDPGHYLIGSEANASIQLPRSSTTSARHAILEVEPNVVRVKDLGSVSGTFLNGAKVTSAILKTGDVIACGKTATSVLLQQSFDALGLSKRAGGTDSLASPAELAATIAMAPATTTEPSAPTLPTIRGYAQLSLVGRGGLGTVYRAMQLGTTRIVAIKCILPELEVDERTRQVFMREASISSQLKHPRIVECLGFGLTERRPYLVMEYISSSDLETIVLQHPQKRRVRLAVKVVMQILEALAHAHSNGIVHRDIKPPNVLASTTDGRLRLKVADFGLAKMFESAGYSGITGSNEICGTLHYMSPEQLKDSRSSKPESDVYSAVVCLYRLLTGEFPYSKATPAEMIQQRLNSEAIPAQKFNSEIPDDLAKIVGLGLSRSLEARFPTATALSALPVLQSSN